MRILRWAGITVGALVGALLLVGFLARFLDGPIGPIGGGPLESGDLVAETGIDWTFATDFREMEFQLVASDRSRTTWLLVRNGELFIPCGLPNSFVKQWPQEAMTDGRSILRIAGKRYELAAVRVTEPEAFAALSRIVAAKYGMAIEDPPPQDDLWFFRMDPRQAN